MQEKTLNAKTIYDGRILRLEVQDVALEDGRVAFREIVRHRGAAAVLARLPDGRFVFVRQFRKPVERVMLEVVAGIREDGESAADCARREIAEETGYRTAALRRLGEVFPTPGYVDERIDLFFAELEPAAGRTHCDADERVEAVLLDRAEVLRRIRANEITDSKTLAAWLLFEKSTEHGE